MAILIHLGARGINLDAIASWYDNGEDTLTV